ncbi:hypothetical protein [Agrilutibacter niabensis]|uniref:hypothetical protein n=1 Tax=Agrilutibacter niabensis TaxID=380628 RepID=UPI00286AF42D|nr:hypothetical protein [Lysobacter niabensis]
MSHPYLANLIVRVAVLVSAGCLSASPTVLAQPVTGFYGLTFVFDGELVLRAHVEDGSGHPAQGGTVTFQYCSLKGIPSNDITQPDEAPSSACANGSGTWATLGRVPVNPETGDALLDFGLVSVVNTIGFRYRYVGQGTGIQNKLIDPVDWNR